MGQKWQLLNLLRSYLLRISRIFLIFFLPLSLIGAFFLPLPFKAFLLFFLLAFYNFEKLLYFLKIFTVLSISILPFLLGMLIGSREGKVINIFSFQIYSDGIAKALNYFFLISIFSIFSFFLFKVLVNLSDIKENIILYKRLSFFFLTIELYQELLKDFFLMAIRLNFRGIVEFIDKKYVELKEKNKNITHQSNES